MAARKFMPSMQHRIRSSGYHPRAHPARPLGGKQHHKQDVQVKHSSPHPALLRNAAMLVLRLEGIYRTAQQIQSAMILLPCDRHADIVEKLRDGVCNPIAEQARLARMLLGCLGGSDLLDGSVISRQSARISQSEKPEGY